MSLRGESMKVVKVIEKEVEGLGVRIKEAREADKRPLTQICAEAGMTPTNWYRIEAESAKTLPIETLRKIEQVLNTSFDVDL